MKEIQRTIEMHATAEVVWDVLTDFAAWAEWNPLLTRAEGVAEVGARLRIRVQPARGPGAMFTPEIRCVEPGRLLQWLGQAPVPGLIAGEHSLIIEPLGDARVRFTQRQRFSGALVPLLGWWLDANVPSGFDAMNRALKQRVERMRHRDTRAQGDPSRAR